MYKTLTDSANACSKYFVEYTGAYDCFVGPFHVAIPSHIAWLQSLPMPWSGKIKYIAIFPFLYR